jgi:cell volume regulation protein A
VAAAAPRGIFLGLSGFVFSLIAICGFLWLSTELGYVRPAPPLAWLMVGAIVAGTSSVIIMPTMAMARVPPRVARMLEVESSATDALSVVVTMVLIDLLVSGSADISRPFIALTRELGVGVALGVIAAALLVPGIPSMRDRPHGYTVFLASMLALYGITGLFRGNGAMAVLVASVLVGNASSIVPRLFPGAHGLVFAATQTIGVMQDQMTFLIKSFFFFLIGLMFPTDLKTIVLAAVGLLFLMAMRVPAVLLSTRRMGLGKKEFWFLCAALPRGLAAGVLATLPMQYGVSGAENLAPVIFAVIVLSVLVFAIGFSIVGRLPDEPAPLNDHAGYQESSAQPHLPPKILPVNYVRLTSSETHSVVRFERLYPLTDEVHQAIREVVHRTGDLDRSFLLQVCQYRASPPNVFDC